MTSEKLWRCEQAVPINGRMAVFGSEATCRATFAQWAGTGTEVWLWDSDDNLVDHKEQTPEHAAWLASAVWKG